MQYRKNYYHVLLYLRLFNCNCFVSRQFSPWNTLISWSAFRGQKRFSRDNQIRVHSCRKSKLLWDKTEITKHLYSFCLWSRSIFHWLCCERTHNSKIGNWSNVQKYNYIEVSLNYHNLSKINDNKNVIKWHISSL